MPEITVIHIAIFAAMLILGVVLGWVFRGNRSSREKTAIGESWQEQMAAQRTEHERLLDQNKSLMDQNSQFQASNKDAKMRASELSGALKETFERRDELQRQIKDVRNTLELAVAQRNRLQSDIEAHTDKDNGVSAVLQKKDDKIAKLNSELESWQDRLPPLIERFRLRNEDAERLEEELAAAKARIAELEAAVDSDETRAEQVDSEVLADGLDASNDPIEETDEADHGDSLTDIAEIAALVDHSEIELQEVFADGHSEADDEDEDEDDDVADEAPPRDDLKVIKGIGPAIEKTLNEMGVFCFDQIAEMTEYDIDRIAHRLKGFRSRIYREDWIGQARDLNDQKASGQS